MKNKNLNSKSNTSTNRWKILSIILMSTLFPWCLYLSYKGNGCREKSNKFSIDTSYSYLSRPFNVSNFMPSGISQHINNNQIEEKKKLNLSIPQNFSLTKIINTNNNPKIEKSGEQSKITSMKETTKLINNVKSAMVATTVNKKIIKIKQVDNISQTQFYTSPVLGEASVNGSKPLFGAKHIGEDAIFALACNYGINEYKIFAGSLRKFGFNGDIVLAVSPLQQISKNIRNYLNRTRVLAYPFEVDCLGADNCKLKDNFLGYPDPRPHRTFANIRYALYEYWLQYYSTSSYILILDFRDTFFQGNPFGDLPKFDTRKPKYDLRLFQENFKVKNIGKCVFNSLWVGRCFGKAALAKLKEYPVLCSGSTMGSGTAVYHYLRTMLASMDTVQCWRKGIESDQGYQNYLYYNGYFTSPDGLTNATAFAQGEGVVNTIGALNGYRVPKEMKGPLDTHWKIRNSEGFITNNDGTVSACVHQWDRWSEELTPFVHSKIMS